MAVPEASAAESFAAVDWGRWRADETAVLIFVLQADQVLLIRKKRGLGAGKITAPGGRQEPGESLVACARRELHEEVGLQAADEPSPVGWLRFQFTHGYNLEVHLFRSLAATGTPCETDEALPLWFPCDALPLAEMWEDDALWLPQALAGQAMFGNFLYEGERMLGYRVWSESVNE